MENRLASTLPKSVLVAKICHVTGHDHFNRIGLKDSLLCALCGGTKEVDLGHIQICQSLTDAMDNVNSQDTYTHFFPPLWKLLNLYWTTSKKMGDILLIGIR